MLADCSRAVSVGSGATTVSSIQTSKIDFGDTMVTITIGNWTKCTFNRCLSFPSSIRVTTSYEGTCAHDGAEVYPAHPGVYGHNLLPRKSNVR